MNEQNDSKRLSDDDLDAVSGGVLTADQQNAVIAAGIAAQTRDVAFQTTGVPVPNADTQAIAAMDSLLSQLAGTQAALQHTTVIETGSSSSGLDPQTVSLSGTLNLPSTQTTGAAQVQTANLSGSGTFTHITPTADGSESLPTTPMLNPNGASLVAQTPEI